MPLAPASLWSWVFFMAKVCVLVDGFNLYRALDTNPIYHRFEWLSPAKLSKCFILGSDHLEKAAQKPLPAKKVGAVIPIGRASEDLKQQTDFHHLLHLISSRFDDQIVLTDGSTLDCPTSWR